MRKNISSKTIQHVASDLDLKDRLAWSPREFAAVAGFSAAFIYREVEAGRLRLIKHGSRSSILREEGLAWLHAGVSANKLLSN